MRHDVQKLRALGVRAVLEQIAGVEWKREGDWWVCRCPFHDDTGPSFKVGDERPDRGRCFSCDAKGDVIALAQRYWQIETGPTIRRLGELFDAAAPATSTPASSSVAASAAVAVGSCPPEHSEIYRQALAWVRADSDTQGPCRAYLEARHIWHSAVAMRVGLVDDPRAFFARFNEWSAEERAVLRASGVTRFYPWARDNAAFLLFGLYDAAGEALTGLIARAIDPPAGSPRYLQAGAAPGPFRAGPIAGMDHLVVLCEGAIDALSWHAAGIPALGVPGAQAWRDEHVGWVPGRRPMVIVAADADAAGVLATARWGTDLAAAGLEVQIAEYTLAGAGGATDANEALVEHGPAALRSLIDRTSPWAEVRAAMLEAAQLRAGGGEAVGAGAPQLSLVGAGAPPTAAEAAAGAAGAGAPPPPGGASAPAAQGGGDRGPMPPLPPGVEMKDAAHLLRGAPWRVLEPWLGWLYLWQIIEAVHWIYEDRHLPEPMSDLVTRHGWFEAVEIASREGVAPRRLLSVAPPERLTDLVIKWFGARGGRFGRTSDGQAWLYFNRRLLRIDEREPGWRGFLYSVGRVNLAHREGKVVATALEQHARSSVDAPEPQSWLVYDRERKAIALHLHDPADTVLLVDSQGATRVQNGDGILLEPDATTRAITLPGAPSVGRAVELLDELLVQSLAADPVDRSLLICWLLSAPLRHLVGTRALVWLQGPAGAGKSEAAKLATTLLHGSERLIAPTMAALYQESAAQPLVVLDNAEGDQVDGEGMRQFLALAASGATRKKRQTTSDRGIVDQKVDSLVMVTAIEPPRLDEHIQRSLFIAFRHGLQRDGYNTRRTLDSIAAHRGEMLGGLLRLMSEGVLGRLRIATELGDHVPRTFSKTRLRDHLGFMALIADAVHQVRPSMWAPGAVELANWCTRQGQASVEVARSADPICDGLARLLWSWNRLAVRGQEKVRPAMDDALFRCAPLYVDTRGRYTAVAGESALHLDDCVGGHHWPRVVGFVGDFADLYADLLRAVRLTDGGLAFGKAVGSQAVLSARWRHNAAVSESGWKAEMLGRSARTRRYRFVLEGEESPDDEPWAPNDTQILGDILGDINNQGGG